jgi:hypothetical protein
MPDEISADQACVPQADGFCHLTLFDDSLVRDHHLVRYCDRTAKSNTTARTGVDSIGFDAHVLP